MRAGNVTKPCAVVCMAHPICQTGELGFPIAGVCCGWITFVAFFSHPASTFNPVIPFLKENSLGWCWAQHHSHLQRCHRGRRSCTSQFTGWTARKRSFFTLSHCLCTGGVTHWANKGCLTVSSPSVCMGKAVRPATLVRKGPCFVFPVQHLAQCGHHCLYLHQG